jgi:flagellar basal body rod protein FlgC
MIDAITSALSGLQNASARVEKGAANIASGGSPDRVIEDIVDIKQAEVSYKANIQTMKVAQDLTRELIDSFDREV